MIVERVPPPGDVGSAFAWLFGESRWACWLDSARAEPGLARFSYLGSPGADGEVLTYAVGQGQVVVTAGGREHREDGTILEALRRRLAPATERGRSCPRSGHERPQSPGGGEGLPFELVDGWVGYLGYELKGDLGSTNRHVSQHPDAVWMRCDRLLVIDHATGAAWLVAHGSGAAAWLAWARETLHINAARPPCPHHPPRPGWPGTPPDGSRRAATLLVRSVEQYRQDVEACLDALRRGESYEICLTDTVLAESHDDPFDIYLRLRRLNPAPHAAYLRLGDRHVLSASPELFLRVTRDGEVSTKPIKGTARRHTDPTHDARAAADLAADAKTRAENLMIADLLRNDLSRVCDPATIHVPRLMHVESYATVHQLVTTVRGRLAEDRTAIDAVEACFPGGSMTGAPKHRTMQIIDELEARARGIYSGALGFIDRSGAVDLSVVIRTAVMHHGQVEIGAGGAIVLDSDPQAETDEMLLKADAVLPALRP
ncbi:aminodeoxychorismate synthase component I [Arsenicicoccus cauae]|uniref:aminodeoxychorismate synthase n=1 Tax=Arsenicicoccus cauae TaxID=2663847 RepID=A0A6I3IH95_9MICO|nr:aminodeoxychorismate synthase component I [Arsenicicoccus cauae]MTB71085.1 aminodeoxychorismate synthase component I [Arsenicicoccus cauae]